MQAFFFCEPWHTYGTLTEKTLRQIRIALGAIHTPPSFLSFRNHLHLWITAPFRLLMCRVCAAIFSERLHSL